MDLVDALLARAHELLTLGWCRRNLAERAGEWCLVNDRTADAWSLKGSLERAGDELTQVHGATQAIVATAQAVAAVQVFAGDSNLHRWNEAPGRRAYEAVDVVAKAQRSHIRRAA